ncbi:hypothetical protein I3843_11G154700 [Carya illinoinensis]|uniref:DUF641 domain-containing protein n=2 Tax=Carya illinoinensis TaxID=32201 RepID=A0A8T1P743_CARIL|nr:protein GRAVITROPIC IN THE LIGHT 1-like isoform X2 [Carya illinoinensis]XP_042948278.1 protein GRAVITROPIC IN THE LIGHT 1-like isoform X2 [Carya illinoinensis]XP_042948279.1 protein GRAVITROPIC IN THE LIGHT 1-like isoform X2 [Carya illinoinensis]XP_042948280.1 protein GRAVITROPIC IN THE LIGHT 1-like isoform X2 [Carya illinoinensis]KAG2681649.1 hypothetical protein I3760_11G154100 [Carya illinoinensis]KAG2681650.1 hypothetical protein I3760_11G154100 [Carya illinoinensis]KAG2681657.1 hypoth
MLQMDSVKSSDVTPAKGKLGRTFAKVLHLRVATGVAPVDGNQKVKPQEKIKKDWNVGKSAARTGSRSPPFDNEEELENMVALQALLAKLFATISSIKAAYAELQYSQSPYNADGIQAADQMVVSELKNLSEFKQSYLKRQFDPSPETAMLSAEIQEQKSVKKTYDIMRKKLYSQLRLKDSELIFLREKLEEATKQNRLLDKRLNQSGQLYVLDNLHRSGLTPTHLVTVLRHAVKSIRSFVRLMVEEMQSAGWDIHAAANAIEPGVVYLKDDHKCFVFESFVCKQMFEAFNYPNFSLPDKSLPGKRPEHQLFFRLFMDMKSGKPKEFLEQNPKSKFSKFCRVKYLQLVNPKLESSLFGNLNQRNLVKAGEFPNTTFFASFAEMAKRVWLLHCLAFSFEPEASIFQVNKGCRFSEVYMESVADEAFLSSDDTPESDPRVAFTVVPGFRIDKTVIQCQVYLSVSNQGNQKAKVAR